MRDFWPAQIHWEFPFADAIEEFGLNPREISLAILGDDILGYVDFHIEQGPVLETMKLPLGVVDAVAGQSRLEFVLWAGPTMRV